MGFRVSCSCGNEVAIETSSVGRPITCAACRVRSMIVWGIDPKTKKASPIALEASGESPRGFQIPLGMFELPCPCGQRLYSRPKQAGKRVQCPVCGIWLKLEHGRDPQTLETRILVVKSRLNQLPIAPPSAKSVGPSNPQLILCDCGESFRVESAASGNQTQCPSCGTRLRLEVVQGSDPSCIVINRQTSDQAPGPESRGIDEALSLDDFN